MNVVPSATLVTKASIVALSPAAAASRKSNVRVVTSQLSLATLIEVLVAD
jgi:hypothetical protein